MTMDLIRAKANTLEAFNNTLPRWTRKQALSNMRITLFNYEKWVKSSNFDQWKTMQNKFVTMLDMLNSTDETSSMDFLLTFITLVRFYDEMEAKSNVEI